jgi:hypothetical protein
MSVAHCRCKTIKILAESQKHADQSVTPLPEITFQWAQGRPVRYYTQVSWPLHPSNAQF